MADTRLPDNLFKQRREIIPEEFLNKLIRLSYRYKKGKNGTAVSREIAEILKMRFPEKEEDLDKMSFSFVRDGSAVVKVTPKNEPGFQDFLSTSITGKEWCPLTIDVILLAFGTRNENALRKISEFVLFLRDLSPETAYIIPEQKQLKVLFNWFVDKVWFNITVENFKRWDRNWRLLKWTYFPEDKQIVNRVVIPASSTLKEIATHILSVGTIISDKQGEKDWDLHYRTLIQEDRD